MNRYQPAVPRAAFAAAAVMLSGATLFAAVALPEISAPTPRAAFVAVAAPGTPSAAGVERYRVDVIGERGATTLSRAPAARGASYRPAVHTAPHVGEACPQPT